MADEQRSDDNTTPDGRDSKPHEGGEPQDQPQQPPADATEVIPTGDATAMLRPPVDPYIDHSETTVIPADQGGPADAAGAEETSVLPAEDVWTGRAEVRPAEPALRDGTPPPTEQPREGNPRWWTPLLLGLLALLLLAAVIFGVWLSLRDSQQPAPLPSATTAAPATSAAPSPSPTLSPSPLASSPAALVIVPADLIGRPAQQAVDELVAAGLSPSLIYEASDEPEGTVIAVDPAVGSQVPAGAQVKLTIAVPESSPRPSPSTPSPSPSD